MIGNFVRTLRAGTALLVLAATPAFTSDRPADTGRAFNWFANANPQTKGDAADEKAIIRAKAAIQKARVLEKGATWVCSPAGFGQGSTCYKG